MPCRLQSYTDGSIVYVCGGRTKPPPPCEWCSRPGRFLCDGKVKGGGGCDRPICKDHSSKIGPDKDLCPTCFAQLKMAAARQLAVR